MLQSFRGYSYTFVRLYLIMNAFVSPLCLIYFWTAVHFPKLVNCVTYDKEEWQSSWFNTCRDKSVHPNCLLVCWIHPCNAKDSQIYRTHWQSHTIDYPHSYFFCPVTSFSYMHISTWLSSHTCTYHGQIKAWWNILYDVLHIIRIRFLIRPLQWEGCWSDNS